MARDIVYYYDKKSPYQQHELGEIQTDFNFSAVIDGTKDSCQVIVLSFDEPAIEPYTIVKLNTLGLWYIISEDKVERYLNENGSFVYKHQLSLLGAKELLNARDLTDCGFYQNRYTIDDFIRRIIKLSSFEFPYTIEYSSNGSLLLDQTKVVDYIKTYQNFTPLSALRDFLDGYNCTFRLDFTTITSDNITYLDKAKIKIISKTGDIGLTQLPISHFDDVRETKNLNKDSFGTTTISNAENVISSKTKFYPSTGAARLITDQKWKVERDNAIWRLPSDIYKINYIKIVCDNILFQFFYTEEGVEYGKTYVYNGTMYDANFKRLLETTVANDILAHFNQSKYDAFIENIDSIVESFQKFTSVKIYSCMKYDGTNNKFFFLPNAPTDAKIARYIDNELGSGSSVIGLFDSDTRNTTRRPDRHFWYEKGKNSIHLTQGWTGSIDQNNWMRFTTPSFEIKGTGTPDNSIDKYAVYTDGSLTITAYRKNNFQLRRDSSHSPLEPYNNAWRMVCEYIPMSDIKIKIDNELETKDVDLYNQTGKQTDSVALSKLLDTHSTDISSNTITKYKNYYDYNDIPKLGQRVLSGSTLYVINNISYDVFQNENTDEDNDKVQYYFECEFTLSKEIATKSVMVNPDTDIRDYGIPQTYNVKRKQLYRDYYSFDLSSDSDADTDWYIDLYTFISFDVEPAFDQNFVLLIKAGANYWKYSGSGDAYDTPVAYNYYQIEATNYLLKKSFYVVFDFQDNNIIGYDAQSSYAGFDITRLFDRSDNVSTPISYTDQDGFVKSFELLITNQSTIAMDDTNSIKTNRVFIDDTFYNLNKTSGYLALIDEQDYEKDPTEVPVFEYACQLGNSKNVIVGENLLAYEENATYLYGYVLRDYNTTTENNAESYAENEINFAPIEITDAVKVEKGVVVSTPQTNESTVNVSGISNTFDGNSFDYYTTRTITIDGTLTNYEIISKGPNTTDVYITQNGNQLTIEMHSNFGNLSVSVKLKITSQTTANTLYKNQIKLSFYQSAVPLANSYVNQVRPTTGKDLCVYRYMIDRTFINVADITALTQAELDEINPNTLVYSAIQAKFYIITPSHNYNVATQNEIDALVLKRELVFIIRNYTFIGGNQDLILYINHYKVD